MTGTDRDLTRALRSWLREDHRENADRVLFTVLDQLDTTPQRRASWLARRFPIMNSTTVRFGLAAAAVVLLALLGSRFLPATTNVGDPTPEPTPTPEASPTASATIPAAQGDSLEPGTYMLGDPVGPVGVAIEVPNGWDGFGGGAVLNGEEGATFAAIGLWDITEIIVYRDPCRWESSRQLQPRGVDAIAAALAGQRGRDASEPAAVTVAGVAGVHVRLTVPADLATEPQADGDSTFVDCDQGQYTLFGTTADPGARYNQGVRQVDDLYIFEAGGRTLVLDVTYFPQTSDSDREDLQAMLDSARIE